MRTLAVTFSLIFVAQALWASDQFKLDKPLPRAYLNFIKTDPGEYQIDHSHQRLDFSDSSLSASVAEFVRSYQTKWYHPITCEDFASQMLSKNNLGTFQRPNPHKSFLSRYGHDKEFGQGLPYMQVQWIPHHAWVNFNLDRPHQTQTMTAGYGSGHSYVDDIRDNPHSVLWHLTLTDTQDQSVSKTDNIIPFGDYTRTYVFEVVNSECRLKKIEVGFLPRGEKTKANAYSETFEFERCNKLAAAYVSKQFWRAHDARVNNKIVNKSPKETDPFGEMCTEVYSHFPELEKIDQLLETKVTRHLEK